MCDMHARAVMNCGFHPFDHNFYLYIFHAMDSLSHITLCLYWLEELRRQIKAIPFLSLWIVDPFACTINSGISTQLSQTIQIIRNGQYDLGEKGMLVFYMSAYLASWWYIIQWSCNSLDFRAMCCINIHYINTLTSISTSKWYDPWNMYNLYPLPYTTMNSGRSFFDKHLKLLWLIISRCHWEDLGRILQILLIHDKCCQSV